MGLDRTCAVWVLALAAAACSSPAEQLGEQAPTATEGEGAQPGQDGAGQDGVGPGAAGAAVQGTGGDPGDGPAAATGGAGGSPSQPGPGGEGGTTLGVDDPVPEGGEGPVVPPDDPIEDAGIPPEQDASDDPLLDAGTPDAEADACQPEATWYGPPPCTTDAECKEQYGEQWYCDQEATFEDSCGNTSVWPVCKERATDAGSIDAGDPDAGADACEPLDYYGPRPCTSDAECETDHGVGWYCDKENTFDDGCGNVSTYPICSQAAEVDAGEPDAGADACIPAAYYGPMQCTDDAQCVEINGEGWYCDRENTASDGCGTTSVWPVCRQS